MAIARGDLSGLRAESWKNRTSVSFFFLPKSRPRACLDAPPRPPAHRLSSSRAARHAGCWNQLDSEKNTSAARAHRRFSSSRMNIFRLAGDGTHLLSFVVLLLKILATRSCRGREWRRQGAGAAMMLRRLGPGPAHGVPPAASFGATLAHRTCASFALHGPCDGAGRAQTSSNQEPTLQPPHTHLPTGISLKTQELYTLVFVCRYLDLFTR